MIFKDRRDAGTRLADALADYAGSGCVVLAIPRGGVPLARIIADRLRAPLDVLLVRKLGVPGHPEVAMGAIMEGNPPIIIRNESIVRRAWVSGVAFTEVCERELAELHRRRTLYTRGHPALEVAGRTVLVVDDGAATGATLKAAVTGLRKRNPARIVVALPVSSSEAFEEIGALADEMVCLEVSPRLSSIGAFYADFIQLFDEEVMEMTAEPVVHLAT